MTAYYNEHDPKAAAWLRELIKHGHIAPGVVDERDIRDVRPSDLHTHTQCHFFAGIGVWSHALRRAGWPDDRRVWTGSCPCQPFSAAGKGGGFDDERHLWPAWFWLIRQCRPDTIFGEQVEAAIRFAWLDLVQTDLEGEGYAYAAVGLPAAGFGAPHARHRAWFVGHTDDTGSQGRGLPTATGSGHGAGELTAGPASAARVALANDQCDQRGQVCEESGRSGSGSGKEGLEQRLVHGGLVNGYWADADWLPCVDGKARPVEPGTFPLANGAPARVGRLRGYGNAVPGPVAQEFIEAYLNRERLAA